MIAISCLTLSFSLAEYTFMNFPAHTFFVDFSISLKTVPNFPLKKKKKEKEIRLKKSKLSDPVFFIFIYTGAGHIIRISSKS